MSYLVYSECRAISIFLADVGGITVIRGSAQVTLRSTVTARVALATPSKSGSGSECV